MNTITLDRSGARWFVDAALSSISKDDITPVLCAARVTVTGDNAQVLCTDRYRCTLATVGLLKATADHAFLMPREAIVWLGKNLAIYGSFMAHLHRVTIRTSEDGALTVTVSDAGSFDEARSVAWKGRAVKGNFPPVDQLFVTARAADVASSTARLNLNFISEARKLTDRGQTPVLKFTVSATNPKKPGPLLITFSPTAEVLIQPNTF